MEVLALIPARSGSKGIPHKNIANFNGKPLIAHSILQALAAKSITRVVVSTDSKLYAEIAREYGAETPFLRPEELAGDTSTDLEVFQHALKWLYENEGYKPDICVHLRPTYPTRRVEDIDKAVQLLLSDITYDSVRSVVPAPETPFKMWYMDSENLLEPVIKSDIYEAYNMARQLLPSVYLQNACIDVVWSRVLLEHNSMTGARIRGMVMEHFNDIDDEGQMLEAMEANIDAMKKSRIVFDIDGVIASLTPQNDYSKAEPIKPNIELINLLYEDGCTIVLFTARGSLTGKDWENFTELQLKQWGVKYHELIFGKPAADFYVDDRLVPINALKKLIRAKTDSD